MAQSIILPGFPLASFYTSNTLTKRVVTVPAVVLIEGATTTTTTPVVLVLVMA